ncbi:MAG TPA: hypothetical protein VMU92_01160 [Acidobacteriaceae bacterium]|nr:hypothetical protein [Acidobacteriaceae bacterium]
MTEHELKKALADELKSAGLAPYIVRDKSQVLEVSEGFFVEMVLNDGSKLGDAENLIGSIRAKMQSHGVQIISVLRAVWSVKEVERIGPSRGKSGGIKTSVDFRAILESGRRETEVVIEVGDLALKELRERLGSDDKVLDAVEDFLRLQLSWGGAGYWDPVRYPRQILNEAAILYLRTHQSVTAA